MLCLNEYFIVRSVALCAAFGRRCCYMRCCIDVFKDRFAIASYSLVVGRFELSATGLYVFVGAFCVLQLRARCLYLRSIFPLNVLALLHRCYMEGLWDREVVFNTRNGAHPHIKCACLLSQLHLSFIIGSVHLDVLWLFRRKRHMKPRKEVFYDHF